MKSNGANSLLFLLHRYLPADKLRGSGQSPELILGCGSVLKVNHELSVSQPPVANRHSPLLQNLGNAHINNLADSVIGRKNRLGYSEFSDHSKLALQKMYSNGGTAMFALLAMAGDLGGALGPAIVGNITQNAGNDMQKGVLSGCAFPLILMVSLLLLNRAGRRNN